MTDQPPPDRTAELEQRIAELERRSSWRSTVDEGRSGVETAFWAAVHSLFPEEARKHLKVAGREQLLAARVYLDKWIAKLDEEEAAAAEGRPHEKIEIE
jgi:BMFP domain-containing protein YqiC